MKIVSGKIDLTDWGLPEAEEALAHVATAVRRAAEESLKYMLDDEIKVRFPVVWSPTCDGWGNPPVDDPLTIYVQLPLGDVDQPVVVALNLREEIGTDLETCAEDGSFASGLGFLRDALRKLADEIDEVIVIGTGHEPPTQT